MKRRKRQKHYPRKLTKRTRTFLVAFCVISWIILGTTLSSAQAQPAVSRVEPPSWWTQSTLNPVRLLISGKNLKGARVQLSGRGVQPASAPSVNPSGTHLFIDLAIAANAAAGKRTLRITTPQGATETQFEVLAPLNRRGRFQGFSPEDVMYLIMIDRFSDGDPSNNDPPQSKGLYDRDNKFYYHGGDLQGVIDRLPYLEELGVSAIWLTPWYDNYDRLNQIELKEEKPSTGFHGYNPQNFYAVEEHFGTLAKLQELVESAHLLGIKIIQDQVANHTGPYHPWVDDTPTWSWFNGTRASHRKNVFQTWVLHDPRAVADLHLATMEGWFLDFLPDLNQDDPEVRRYLIQNTLWWIGVTGLDGIRMDTWQYVPNHFWRDWNRAIKREFPRFKVFGEVKDGDVVHTSFFQGGQVRFDGVDSGLESLLDFPLFYQIRHAFAEGKNLDEVPKTLAKDYLYTSPEILVTLLGGHDDGRFMSEKRATIQGLKLANAFLLTTRGVPQLYYGDEIAMTGEDEPRTRKDFPGGFPGDRRNAFSKDGRTREEQEVFAYVQKLIRLRRQLEPLRRGSLINLYVSDQQYAYARGSKAGVVIMVFNNAEKSAEMLINLMPVGFADGETLIDRLDVSPEVRVKDRRLRVTMPSRSVSMFVRR